METKNKKEEIIVTQALIEETTSIKKLQEYMEKLRLRIENGNKSLIVIVGVFASSIFLMAIVCVVLIGYDMFTHASADPINHPNQGKFVFILSIVCACILIGIYILWIRQFLKHSLQDYRELSSNKELYTLCEKQKALLLENFTQEIATLSVDTRRYLAENGV